MIIKYATDIHDVLEKIQRRAMKCVQGLNQLYESVLKAKSLYSLFCRCQRGDMIETYKILNRYYNMDPSTFFTLNISHVQPEANYSSYLKNDQGYLLGILFFQTE